FLFYVDARIKEMDRSFAWMSRFTVGIYAVSVLGLFLSLAGPVPRIMALSIGAVVYAVVIWRYLTLTPLWMMLTCLFGLYGLVILGPLPPEWHFAAVLPGMAGLWGMQRLALKRRSMSLARMLFRVRTGAGIVLAAWSLWHGAGSTAAMATGMFLTGWFYAELRWTSIGLLTASAAESGPVATREKDLRETPWFHAVPAGVVLTLAVSPPWIIADGLLRFAGGLLAAALVWTASGLRQVKSARPGPVYRGTVLLNGAVVAATLAAAMAVGRVDPAFRSWTAIPIFASAGGLFLWMGIALRDRLTVCPALVLAGVAGVLAKRTFFPGPSTGLTEMALCLVLWAVLWRMERIHRLRTRLTGSMDTLSDMPKVTLLGCHPVHPRPLAVAFEPPLTVAVTGLWFLGMIRLGMYLPAAGCSISWTLSAAIATTAAFLLLIRKPRPGLLPVPLIMGLATILVPLICVAGFRPHLLSALIASYALLIRVAAGMPAKHPLMPRLAAFLLPGAA
ncbi:MAG TPA: hypothetical protein VLT88_02395, partial [Desulfosarcina sp.]|nr:hypothetical protein [Desulfosarcina sp.]